MTDVAHDDYRTALVADDAWEGALRESGHTRWDAPPFYRPDLRNAKYEADERRTFSVAALRHLKAGCPAPKLDPGPTTLPAMCGGLTLHA